MTMYISKKPIDCTIKPLNYVSAARDPGAVACCEDRDYYAGDSSE